MKLFFEAARGEVVRGEDFDGPRTKSLDGCASSPGIPFSAVPGRLPSKLIGGTGLPAAAGTTSRLASHASSPPALADPLALPPKAPPSPTLGAATFGKFDDDLRNELLNFRAGAAADASGDTGGGAATTGERSGVEGPARPTAAAAGRPVTNSISSSWSPSPQRSCTSSRAAGDELAFNSGAPNSSFSHETPPGAIWANSFSASSTSSSAAVKVSTVVELLLDLRKMLRRSSMPMAAGRPNVRPSCESTRNAVRRLWRRRTHARGSSFPWANA
mmetsp:Transcript_153992/g.492306  ORF Transcript_153992/g.492306 Transcript_153992/m.492306 type:complete len:273 (+) Transcript_153992:1033-1851(+)